SDYPPDSLEMHHPDAAGDSGGVRKMAHPAAFHRRGSGSALSSPANPVVNNSHVPGDDYQPSLLIQCQPPAGSSSPGPHHVPPHSLNLHSQPQPAQQVAAQTKKKSGFQITSVTPAQISVSTNNSIAEDTESYDDLDESHTEDLSSSEILDVSLSRANDIVGAERSSSEETLNNFHEAQTPGAVSPNQPSHPHALNQAQQHGGALVNGNVHHHHHPHHPNHAQVYPRSPGPGSTQSAQNPGALPFNPQTSTVSNVNVLSSANVPVRGGMSVSTSSSTGGYPLNVMSSGGGSAGGVGAAAGGNLMSNNNVGVIQQHQNINSSITMTSTTTAAAAAVGASGGIGLSGGIQGRVGPAVVQHVSGVVTAVAPVPVASAAIQPAQAAAPAVVAASSRFRVVKLDSSSEPFKKGRWTCTEFHDKDTPASAPTSSSSDAGSLSARQFVSESFAAAPERESTSGSSVSSTMSTLSHYNDSVCTAEAGGLPAAQHAQDYASSPQGFQGVFPSGLNMGVSQPQMHPADITHSHVTTTVAPSAPTHNYQLGHHAASGLPASALPNQQLTYAQAVANQSSGTTQGLMGVQQQQAGYVSLPQQPAATPQAASLQGRPPEYAHPHQGVSQAAAASQPLSHHTGSACQMMGGPQQPPSLQTSSMSPHVGLGQQPQSHPVHQDFQPPIPNQGVAPQLPTTVHQSQVSAQSVPPSNPQSAPQPHSAGNSGRMPPQGAPQSQLSGGGLSQDHSSVLALVHAAQASALYASLPTFTTTQLQDAQRLLLQHQSTLLGLPKLSGGEAGSGTGLGMQAMPSVGKMAVKSSCATACFFSYSLPAGAVGLPASTRPPWAVSVIPPKHAGNVLNHGRHSCGQNTVHKAIKIRLAFCLNYFISSFQRSQPTQAHSVGSKVEVPEHSNSTSVSPACGGQNGHSSFLPCLSDDSLGSGALSFPIVRVTFKGPLVSVLTESSSGASVVAIDNKIEQAMDLVKSHLMYAVREEVEVLKEQIKELIDRNSQLEQENTLLKTLASPEQMAQFQAQVQTGSPPAPPTAATPGAPGGTALAQPSSHSSGPSA
uniref:TSC22 domain family protein 1 n=1 Tax=Gasterosteus aculeatus TaxID=69293 RepID=G3NUW6_GASAC